MLISRTYPSAEAITPLFKQLRQQKLYLRDGVLRRVYASPKRWINGECKLILRSYSDEQPVGVALVIKGNLLVGTGGFEPHHIYGHVLVYTHPDHRCKGIATEMLGKLFADNPKLRFTIMAYARRYVSSQFRPYAIPHTGPN